MKASETIIVIATRSSTLLHPTPFAAVSMYAEASKVVKNIGWVGNRYIVIRDMNDRDRADEALSKEIK